MEESGFVAKSKAPNFWTDMWGKLKRQFASTGEDFLRFTSQIPKFISVIK